MDRFLAGNGYWVAWLAAALTSVATGEGEHRPLAFGFGFVVTSSAVPLALRASALRGDRERNGQPPPPRPALVRRWVTRLRWPLAVAYGAGAAWFAQWHYDVPWLSVVAGAVATAVVAYAARPLPAYGPAAGTAPGP